MNSLPFKLPNSLEAFAKTAEAVAATTKKLAKAALLGEFFQQLDDDDLPAPRGTLPANSSR